MVSQRYLFICAKLFYFNVHDLQNYLEPLKSPEFAGIVDGKTVDDIFLMVPTLLYLHDRFLIDLKNRLELWDLQRCVGDVFIDSVSNIH